MTRALVAAGAFADNPMVLVDIGSRGGVDLSWQNFGPALQVIGFEPDPAECARLNAQNQPNVRHIQAAVDGKVGERELYIMRYNASTSFFPMNLEFQRRFFAFSNQDIAGTAMLRTTTLREALAGLEPDFIKLDTEGAEVDALQAANMAPVLGIVSEVRFTGRMQNCPTFSDLDRLCTSEGLELYDLDLYRYARRALPYPYLYDFRDNDDGRPVPGPTTQGQVLTGDAVYFRDGLTTSKPLKLACLFEIFGLADCAAEVVQAHWPAFESWMSPDRLLDLLVPEVKGERLSFREHQARHAAHDPRFRPTSGYRFPDAEFSHSRYDGLQFPAWTKPLRPSFKLLWRWLRGRADVYGRE